MPQFCSHYLSQCFKRALPGSTPKGRQAAPALVLGAASPEWRHFPTAPRLHHTASHGEAAPLGSPASPPTSPANSAPSQPPGHGPPSNFKLPGGSGEYAGTGDTPARRPGPRSDPQATAALPRPSGSAAAERPSAAAARCRRPVPPPPVRLSRKASLSGPPQLFASGSVPPTWRRPLRPAGSDRCRAPSVEPPPPAPAPGPSPACASGLPVSSVRGESGRVLVRLGAPATPGCRAVPARG
ncbi:uncharacterized protein LOC135180058 [Pogoniulus pusillus]|uniref:uncharacterized protein LOC135180058 n=1 Tax=Pogoniulus pusillus TaxID=488313 RepID=UPI0030B934D2